MYLNFFISLNYINKGILVLSMEVEFDQHYLENKEVLKKIISSSNISHEDIILEIGPGNGILTREILNKNPNKLISIEIDEKHKGELNKIKSSNFEFIFGNGLDLFSQLKFNKIIANIPYAITENLYSQILDNKIPEVILLHGIDFYKNIVQRQTRWNYFVNSMYDIELIDEVDGNSFNPPTKVKSCVVKLSLKENKSKFDIFIELLFSKRFRSLKNALIFSLVDSLDISKKEAKELISVFSLKEVKLNQLSNLELVNIIEELKKKFR